jgi:hypothetical protein
MKRRYGFLVAAVAVLLVLNLWQWKAPSGNGNARPRGAAAAGGFRAEDFQLKVGLAMAEPARAARNLFQPKLPPPPPPAPVKVVEAQPEPPPGPPPKSAEEIAEEASRAEIAQIKLVGVVFRGDKGQAFLVKGEQVFMVHTGGKVGDRFQVEAISPDGIQLKDPATRVTGQIPVSGK